jgi:MFS family permease
MRRLSLSLYLLLALAELVHWAIVPLLPGLADRFGLSQLEAGGLVAATGIATLAVSLPAGVLTDRVGARRLTVSAGIVLTASTLGQALAPSYALLLTARLVFGAGFGILWTAGVAWLAAAQPPSPGRAMGATVTWAGIGTVLAPGFAGTVAQALGQAAPFGLAAAACAAVTAVLATAPRSTPAAADAERATPAALRSAAAEPSVSAALGAVLVAGLAGGTISVLGPLELHSAGFAEGAIGLAFSIAALIFIATSAVTVWLGERVIRVLAVQGGLATIALVLAPGEVSGAATAVIAVMCLTAPLRALLYTTAYPLGAQRPAGARVGAGAVMGLLNGLWALTTVVGPLGAGALAGWLGPRAGYGLLQGLAVATVLAVWLRARRGPALVTA